MLAIILIFLGCGLDSTVPEEVANTCVSICEELVYECGFEAFPTMESCLSGCAYQSEEGGDIDAQNSCVQDAACDTFKIIQCDVDYR